MMNTQRGLIHSCEVRPSVAELDIVFLVAVVYNSGDTFGISEGEVAIVEIVGTNDEAKEIESQIKQGTYNKYAPWDGYFETLVGIEIHQLFHI